MSEKTMRFSGADTRLRTKFVASLKIRHSPIDVTEKDMEQEMVESSELIRCAEVYLVLILN